MKKKIVPNIKHILYVWLWLISISLLTPSTIFFNTNKAMKKMETTVQGKYLQMKATLPVAKSVLEPVSDFEAVRSLPKRCSTFFSGIDQNGIKMDQEGLKMGQEGLKNVFWT